MTFSHDDKDTHQPDTDIPECLARAAPNADAGDSNVPGTSAAMLMATGAGPDMPPQSSADVPTEPAAAASPVAAHVANAVGFEMPPPPSQSRFPGLAFQYSVRVDDAAVQSKQARLKKYRKEFEILQAAGVSDSAVMHYSRFYVRLLA